ncbi:MAG: hypothetical protein HY756_06570 [Nitrospirae bacterium]|nr:hypothetical protein [Nitrospirota bacterium]
MGTAVKQANFLLPEDLIEDLRKNISKRQQSKFVANALKKELQMLRLKNAIKESFGAWKDKEHPELKEGTDAFVRRLRKSSRLNRTR